MHATSPVGAALSGPGSQPLRPVSAAEPTAVATTQQQGDAQVIVPEFEALRKQSEEMAKANALARFDYRSKAGNKDARSHVAKLRVFKADIERAKKAVNEQAKKHIERVNTVAGDLTKLVEDMIAVHATPILAIEKEDEERKAKLDLQLDELRRAALGTKIDTGAPVTGSVELTALLAVAEKVDVYAFGDAAQQVADAKAFAIAQLTARVATAKQAEADAVELVRLRAETAAREKRDQEEAAAKAEKERQEQAERERLAKVEQDRLAAEEAEAQRERERIAREEQVRKDAAEKAAQEERDRIAAEQRKRDEEITAEQKRRDDEAAAELKRQQDAHDAEVQRVKDAAAKEAEELRLKNEEIARQQKAEADRIARELQEKKDAEAREAKAAENKKRRALVHQRIVSALAAESDEAGHPVTIDRMVEAIAAGRIPHLSITYTDAP